MYAVIPFLCLEGFLIGFRVPLGAGHQVAGVPAADLAVRFAARPEAGLVEARENAGDRVYDESC